MHPGYGFFSENADFARAITDRGRGLHRPAARGHRGHGRQGRRAASPPQRAGVPGVPGTTEFLDDGRRGRRLRRGVRLAGRHQGRVRRRRPRHAGRQRRPTRPRARSSRRQREALKGLRPRRVLRRALPHLAAPRRDADLRRHSTATCVWVGERDCSAQRRHQKLIEESPGAGLPRRHRARRWARPRSRSPRPCGYYNAGTVEFLYQDGEFFFLEMNTRLQVEHPVTEMVTGIDLVARADPRRRRASRCRSPRTTSTLRAATPSRSGSTPRTRPAAGSCRRPGTITKLRRRPTGFGVRWDGGYESGDEVSQYYDNLVGKLIVWGKDRRRAIARTIRALEEMVRRGRRHHDPGRPRHPRATPTSRRSSTRRSGSRRRSTCSGVGVAEPRRRRPTTTRPTPLVERDDDVEVNGKRFDVKHVGARVGRRSPSPPAPAARRGRPQAGGRRRRRRRPRPAAAARSPCPMQGTIVKVLVEVGQDGRGRSGRRACSRP